MTSAGVSSPPPASPALPQGWRPHADALIPTRCYIGLGSNLDDPPGQLRRAFLALEGSGQGRLGLRSDFYRSAPMGPVSQPDYVNAVVAFDTVLSYDFSILPLFILMGNLVSRSRLSEELYAAAHAMLGHRRGGLAMATIAACAGFSAVCGSSLATAATMSKVAMPSMRRYGYADRLAAGSIAAGGTLGILIPPSVPMVIYGILTESDIGKLFIAGVVPGNTVVIEVDSYSSIVEDGVQRNKIASAGEGKQRNSILGVEGDNIARGAAYDCVANPSFENQSILRISDGRRTSNVCADEISLNEIPGRTSSENPNAIVVIA